MLSFLHLSLMYSNECAHTHTCRNTTTCSWKYLGSLQMQDVKIWKQTWVTVSSFQTNFQKIFNYFSFGNSKYIVFNILRPWGIFQKAGSTNSEPRTLRWFTLRWATQTFWFQNKLMISYLNYFNQLGVRPLWVKRVHEDYKIVTHRCGVFSRLDPAHQKVVFPRFFFVLCWQYQVVMVTVLFSNLIYSICIALFISNVTEGFTYAHI